MIKSNVEYIGYMQENNYKNKEDTTIINKKRDYEYAPKEGFIISHFLTVANIQQSADFYLQIFGGKVIRNGEPTIVQIANSWIVLNIGGGPTDDKPAITLNPPTNLNEFNSFLNIRVDDIQKSYIEWRQKGAEFITEPKDHGVEIRCYVRDPDGYIIEIGQTTGGMKDILNVHED